MIYSALSPHDAPICRAVPACPWCGTAGAVLYAGLCDRLYDVPGTWSLRRCVRDGCGLAWLDPSPLATEIPKLYVRYFTHDRPNSGAAGRDVASFVQRFSRPLFAPTSVGRGRRQLDVMRLAGRPCGRVLDVGCGSGDRLLALGRIGWDAVGQDIDPAAAAAARETTGRPVIEGPLADAGIPDASFDAVVLNHVIEHVCDPVALLAECRRVLRPSGVLVAVTPNLDSAGHRRFGRDWLGLDPPRHLYVFSPRTLSNLAVRAGFRDSRVGTSAARAEFIAAGSWDLRWRGRHEVSGGRRPGRDLAAVWVQIAAAFRYRQDPSSGDECVLESTL